MANSVVSEPSVSTPIHSPPRWRDLHRGTRLCLLTTFLLIPTLLLEVSVRLYWALSKGIPALHTEQIWDTFYPEMKESGVAAAPEDRAAGSFDVLILGASVFHPFYGDLAVRLPTTIGNALGRPVRIYNLGYPGRTSLDSYQRYARLGRKRFDLVIFYHGINDTRLNNCPACVFRADYTHAPRYQQIALLDSHPEHRYFALPYSVRYLLSRWQDQLNLSTLPRERWNQYGGELKTPPCFEANLKKIIALAEQRGDPLLLMTFTYHVPSNYTEEAFKAKELDYATHHDPLRLWGTPDNVPRAIDAHNAVVRRLAAEHPAIAFVDQQRLMPAGKRYYNDPCHLTTRGCEAFVDNVMKQVDWKRWAGARTSHATAAR
ncbi:MAG: SGNH/GDSL hydrolase family protein [Planctomycetes bacterium]|nr:SGNH/GDSL hydrolase family protein [Planctomycetota bacterium]